MSEAKSINYIKNSKLRATQFQKYYAITEKIRKHEKEKSMKIVVKN